jgi:small multidrug resistance pump
MSLSYSALLAAVLFGVWAQTLLKAGAGARSLLEQMVAPRSIAGLTLYAVAAVFYMYALRKIPVSIAFPCVSFSYVLIVAIAYLYFDEPLGWAKIAGIALICAGVLLLASGA